jgi:hypothetical protein
MVSRAPTVLGVSSVASDITDAMIEAAAQHCWHIDAEQYADFPLSDWAKVDPPNRERYYLAARTILEAALAGRTVVEPDWTLVEAAVARGIADHAAAYAIPANQLAGGDREQERRMAESWGKTMAPHVTACIREGLRQAGSVGSETPAGDPS